MIRLPAIAGQFYPENRKSLEKMIDDFLIKAEPLKIKGKVFGLLLPHAGYLYSGSVAAYGFKVIADQIFGQSPDNIDDQGQTPVILDSFDAVIIMGDSHCERFDGVSVWPEGEWETPLGRLEIDAELAKSIITASPRFFRRDSAHLFEHSIEAQLPFLQKILKDFKILPIIFGSEDQDWQLLAETILKSMKEKNILIIASADLSHYLPYEEAKKVDAKTLNNITSFQAQNLEACATDSTKTLIEIAKKLGGKAKLLKYANSGDTAGDKPQVVGYGAVAFYI